MALKTFILLNSESKKQRDADIETAVRHYLNKDDVKLSYDDNGKPSLLNTDSRIYISITCANDVMMVVLYHKPVGIDGEYLPKHLTPNHNIDYNLLAERFFSYDEAEFVRDGNEAENFVRVWVRKEAYVKAAGKTLADFPNFSVVDGSRLLPKVNGISLKKFSIKFADSENYLFCIAGVD